MNIHLVSKFTRGELNCNLFLKISDTETQTTLKLYYNR